MFAISQSTYYPLVLHSSLITSLALVAFVDFHHMTGPPKYSNWEPWCSSDPEHSQACGGLLCIGERGENEGARGG